VDVPSQPLGGVLASERSGDVPGDWVEYRDEATGYTIAHPPGWQVKRVDRTRTDFREPRTGSYLRVDWTSSPGSSPEGAWEAFEPTFAARHTGYRRIRIEPTEFQGYPAAVWEFQFSSGRSVLHAVDLGFVTDDYGFALNFQTREENWEQSQDVFAAFQAAFRPPEGAEDDGDDTDDD
jgi:hypothetical protein